MPHRHSTWSEGRARDKDLATRSRAPCDLVWIWVDVPVLLECLRHTFPSTWGTGAFITPAPTPHACSHTPWHTASITRGTVVSSTPGCSRRAAPIHALALSTLKVQGQTLVPAHSHLCACTLHDCALRVLAISHAPTHSRLIPIHGRTHPQRPTHARTYNLVLLCGACFWEQGVVLLHIPFSSCVCSRALGSRVLGPVSLASSCAPLCSTLLGYLSGLVSTPVAHASLSRPLCWMSWDQFRSSCLVCFGTILSSESFTPNLIVDLVLASLVQFWVKQNWPLSLSIFKFIHGLIGLQLIKHILFIQFFFTFKR